MHFTIVSYTYPPSKEIGGRRWAKFSQQLAKRGHAVTVVCANTSPHEEFYKKEFAGIDVKVLPKKYPDWLSGFTKSFFEKILYMIYTRVLSPLTKQNFFDTGYAWKSTMLNALEAIHENKKIDILIVTGAPFSLLYYGALFKNRHQEIMYVSDLRDPWSWGSYYGIPNLSGSKKNFQKFSEFKTMQASDMICYPTQHMGDNLKSIYPEFSSKFYLLPHAYDPDKFPKTDAVIERSGFVYGGTLYNGIESYMTKLAAVLSKNPDSGFRWDIYTGTNYPLIETLFTAGTVRKHSFVPEEQLFEKIKKSSAYLALFPVTDKDLISTKFFEIIYTQTPILYIGEEGDLGRFVRENRLGVHILPENIELELPKYLGGDVPFEIGYFNVLQYTFTAVTDNFLLALEKFRTGK